jgi:hypothetical protein
VVSPKRDLSRIKQERPRSELVILSLIRRLGLKPLAQIKNAGFGTGWRYERFERSINLVQTTRTPKLKRTIVTIS